MKSLGRVWIPAGYRYSIQDESGDRHGSFEVSRMILDTNRMAVKESGYKKIAVESLGRVLGRVGKL